MATLAGKTVLVIGGSSGIGYGVALASLQSLASHVIIASSNPSKVSNATKRLIAEKEKGSHPGQVIGKTVDAKDLSSIESLFKDIGEIDHLAITVGDSPIGTPNIRNANLEAMKDRFDVRFWAPLQAVKSAKFKTGGSVVFTTGSATIKPLKGMGLSVGSSGALEAATRALAVDLSPLRVNCVAPGLVVTELLDAFPPAIREKFIANVRDAIMVKHVATPAEIAEAYLFLMKCGYITGETLRVDGGTVLSDMPPLSL